MSGVSLSDAVYAKLLALRTGLRHFERWSEQQARAAGLTPAQHQLLLAIRGHDDPRGPTIGEVADYLLLRHHSVVGLIDRAEVAGLVARTRDSHDHRIARLHLTDKGGERLEALSALHLEELQRLAPQLPGAWEGLGPVQRAHGLSGTPPDAVKRSAISSVRIARVYDELESDSDVNVLVDPLWPRGLARSDAPFQVWAKEVAPSSELRKWFGHSAARFGEFSQRYRAELSTGPALDAIAVLRGQAQEKGLVLLTATKDLALSHATILREVILEG